MLFILGWTMNTGPIRLRALALALLAAAALAAAPARADVIRLRADLWCPYNCQPGTDRPGYMVEIATEVFAAAGHGVEYRTMNWVRSLEEARRGTVDGVIGANAVEAEGFVLPVPLGRAQDAYAMRRGSRFDPEVTDPFQGIVIGAIRGYVYGGRLTDHIRAHGEDPTRVQLLAGDDALEKNLRKLVAGRVDLVPDDSNWLRLVIHDLGLADAIQIVHEDEPILQYIAFSPANPKSPVYASLLSEGVARLRASGRLRAILDRYGLEDWEQP